ncbi:class I SAM-dependent methyltransferase [Antrihabitans cavernicola]|uniref:Class I SAM-dependent methyltransferase n=1 Tax=Antrihabitans cavernicola TaxID=2495913 RepID=A0A5A7S1R2_9NOCA|nr:class I SAM-dependent methyltransferase [Spelaeibacter cavernicola]KAA0017371.1 class I SAM-dependent methyltransferase [Spelaeibacter cavernicola]
MDAAEWNARYAATDLVWGAAPNTVVVEQVTSLHRGRALDLACGEGRNAIWLATRGWDVTAVDYSQVAIDKARTVATRSPRSVRERIDWVRADVTTHTSEPGYDLVLLVYLHLPAPQRRTVLYNAIAALNDAGVLLVLGHDSSNIADGVGGPQDPGVLFTPEDVVHDIADTLEVLVAEKRLRPTEAGDAIDALVVATKVPSAVDVTELTVAPPAQPRIDN